MRRQNNVAGHKIFISAHCTDRDLPNGLKIPAAEPKLNSIGERFLPLNHHASGIKVSLLMDRRASSVIDANASRSSADFAPLDERALARLRELDPDGRNGVLPRVLAAFESSLLRMTEQLRHPSAQHDPRLVTGIAHTLKSSAASVGALDLSATCAQIETRLREQPATQLNAEIAQLLTAADAALLAVRAMLRL